MFWYLDVESGFDPVLDAGGTGFVGDGDTDRTIQKFVGVETVVYFFVFQQTVGMDAGPGNVEISSDKRIVMRYIEA